MICGDNQSINEFYQQVMNNSNDQQKVKNDEQIILHKIVVDSQPISKQDETDLCSSDQQNQSPAPLKMLFALQNVDVPVFKYHGSNDIAIVKSTNEYSFDSDFGTIVYNNQSYCAWRIQIKYPAEHQLPKINQKEDSQ